MATLTRQLAEPTPSGGSVSPATPNTDVQDALRVAETGLNVFSQVRAQERQKKQQQSLANVQTSLLDLEDERNALVLEDQQLASQVQAITQDGITEDEQAELAALEKQRAKLTKARRSGILNPLTFQTRMNALQKQALADVNNMAIQPQINALFSQGRSRVTAPVPTAQAQFEAQMDQKYGVGNWSGVDAGRERGKAIYLNQLRADANNNFHTLRGKEAIGFMTIADDVVRQTRQALNAQGALKDTDLELYRSRINGAAQQSLLAIDEAVQANRLAGTPIDLDTIKASKQRVLDTQKFYIDFMDKGQEFGDNVRLSQRLADMNRIVDEVNKARNPGFGQIASVVAGTGSNGDIAALAQLASADDSLLQGVVAQLDPALRGNMTADSLKTQAAQAVAFAIDGVDFKDLAAQGLISNNLAATVGSVVFTRSDNEKTIDSFLSAFEGIDFNSTESALDMFNKPDRMNNLKATPKGLTRMPAVATHMWDNITNSIRPQELENLKVNEEGDIEIAIPAGSGMVERGWALYHNKLFEKFNLFLDNYSKEIKMSKEEFIKDILPQEEAVEEGADGE